MKVLVKGKGDVSLGKTHFVGAGGQASVYARDGVAYKIYENPADAIPEGKITELGAIANNNVIRPQSLLLDPKKMSPIGYSMRHVASSVTICQLFPRAYRERNGINPSDMHEFVTRLQKDVQSVHSSGVLIVDLNEFNVLVVGDKLALIDVDSYQTRTYRANAIMPSVRDWSVEPNDFSESSDWFSFAVLAFQLYIGLHPYKGAHEEVKSVPAAERLEYRMRRNLSAFGKGARLPGACMPFSVIPSLYRNWLTNVLERGDRSAPPDGLCHVAVVMQATDQPASGATITITELAVLDGPVRVLTTSGGHWLASTDTSVYIDGKRSDGSGTKLLGFSAKHLLPFRIDSGVVYPIERKKHGSVSMPTKFCDARVVDGRVLIRTRHEISQVDIIETPQGITTVALRPLAQVTESSTQLFDGCAVQNMLGSTWVSLFPAPNQGHQIRIRELEGLRLVDAMFSGGVLMAITAANGTYARHVFRFDKSMSTHDHRIVNDVHIASVNFVVLDNGICVCLNESEQLEVFRAEKSSTGMRIVEDEALGGDMRLIKLPSGCGFIKGNGIYLMRLK